MPNLHNYEWAVRHAQQTTVARREAYQKRDEFRRPQPRSNLTDQQVARQWRAIKMCADLARRNEREAYSRIKETAPSLCGEAPFMRGLCESSAQQRSSALNGQG